MRIISQDGTLYMPYEICTVWLRDSAIMCDMCGDNTTKTVLATYSTKEKAKKAMERLRIAYENNEFYHCTANSKILDVLINALDREKFVHDTSEYFQFPVEEELE